MTSILDGFLALLVAILLNGLILSRLRSSFEPGEGQFLARVYLLTLVIRLLGAIVLNYHAGDSQFADSFWGDSGTYDNGGYLLSRYWAGESFATGACGRPAHPDTVSSTSWRHLLCLRPQPTPRPVHQRHDRGLAVVVIYAIARELFDHRAARWAALFMAFFPQMIFWSCAMYKDPSILLCIAPSMYAVLKLRAPSARATWRLPGRPARPDDPAFLRLLHGRLCDRRHLPLRPAPRPLWQAFSPRSRSSVLFRSRLSFGRATGDGRTADAYFDLERSRVARYWPEQRWAGRPSARRSTCPPRGALAALPSAWSICCSRPSRGQISGIRQLLTVPETLVWYALMPALVRGLIYTSATASARAFPSWSSPASYCRLRDLPEQRGHRLSAAHADRDVLLRLHRGGPRATPAATATSLAPRSALQEPPAPCLTRFAECRDDEDYDSRSLQPWPVPSCLKRPLYRALFGYRIASGVRIGLSS